MQHVSLQPAELNRLRAALVANGNDGAALQMGADTSFLGTVPEVPTEAAVISAVKSVPCHY